MDFCKAVEFPHQRPRAQLLDNSESQPGGSNACRTIDEPAIKVSGSAGGLHFTLGFLSSAGDSSEARERVGMVPARAAGRLVVQMAYLISACWC